MRRTRMGLAQAFSADELVTARASLALLASELRRNLAARDRDPVAVLDVRYEDLIADPFSTAQHIYPRFGLEWADAAALARAGSGRPPGPRSG